MRRIRNILARLYLPLWYVIISFLILGVIAGLFGGLSYELLFGYPKSISISPYLKGFLRAQWEWLAGALLAFLCLFSAARLEYKRREGRKVFRLYKQCEELEEPSEIEFRPNEDRPWQHEYISCSLAEWPLSDETPLDDSKVRSEEDLASALREEKWTLLIGRPNLGKTRTVFEVVRNHLEDFYAVIPDQTNLDLSSEAKWLLQGKKIIFVLDDLHEYVEHGSVLLRYIEKARSEAQTCGVIATCRDGRELDTLRNIGEEGYPIGVSGGDKLYEHFQMRLTLVEPTHAEKRRLERITNQDLNDEELKACESFGDVALAERKRKMKYRFERLAPKDQDVLRVLQLLDVADLSPTRERVLQVSRKVFDRTSDFRDDATIRDSLSRLAKQSFVSRPSDANPVKPKLGYVGNRFGVVNYLEDRTPQSDLDRLLCPLMNIKDGEGLVTLGRTFGADYQKWDEAIDCFDLAISLNEKNAEAWGNKGYALSRKNDYEPAIGCYNRALEIDENYTEALNSKGYALRELGKREDDSDRFEEALLCFDRAIDLNEDYAAAWNLKGYTLVRLDRSEKALKCFEKAITLQGNRI